MRRADKPYVRRAPGSTIWEIWRGRPKWGSMPLAYATSLEAAIRSAHAWHAMLHNPITAAAVNRYGVHPNPRSRSPS